MRDLTKGNAAGLIIRFALPMLFGNIFQQFYSMADAVIVGKYVDGSALAAVGSALSVVNFLIAVLIGLTTGASVVISQLFGAKQEENLRRAVSTSAVFMLILSAVISVLGVVMTPLFLRWLDTPADIFGATVAYLRIILGGMVFPIFYNMYTAYMRALGESVSPLIILVFATLLNVGLDLLFVAIFSFGVAGAAWATILSQAVSFLLCYLWANRRVPLLRIRTVVFDRALFRPILRYSIPAALQLSLTSLASLSITNLINSFGTPVIAGYTAAVKFDQFAIMPLSSVSMAASTFVGQNMGAGLTDRAKKGFRSALGFMVLLGVLLSALVILFSGSFIRLFVDPADPAAKEIIRVGEQYLEIIALFYTLFAVFFAFNGFFRGVGDAVIVMELTASSLFIRAASAHLLVANFGMGPEAVAWSIPVGWGLCSLFCWFYYKKGFWKGKEAVNGLSDVADS